MKCANLGLIEFITVFCFKPHCISDEVVNSKERCHNINLVSDLLSGYPVSLKKKKTISRGYKVT